MRELVKLQGALSLGAGLTEAASEAEEAAEKEGPVLPDTEKEEEAELWELLLKEAEPEELGQALLEAWKLAVAGALLAMAEVVCSGEEDTVAVTEAEDTPEAEPTGEPDMELPALALLALLAEGAREREARELPLADKLSRAEALGLQECPADAVDSPEATELPLPLGEAVSAELPLGLQELTKEPVACTELLALLLCSADAEGRTEGVWLPQGLAEAELLSCPLGESRPEELAALEELGHRELLAAGVDDSREVLLRQLLELPEGVGPTELLALCRADTDAEEELLGRTEALSSGLPEGEELPEPDMDSKGLLLLQAEPTLELEALPQKLPL